MFLLGTLAGFGVALLVFVARLLDPKWSLLHLSSANAFLAGICRNGGTPRKDPDPPRSAGRHWQSWGTPLDVAAKAHQGRR